MIRWIKSVFIIYPCKAVFCFCCYCTVLLYAQIFEYIMARWSYSCVCTLHYLIIILRTYLKVLDFWKPCQIHSVQCVSKIKTILSIIFQAMYRAVCIQLTHFSYDLCENTCTLSCYHHQIGSMTHLPLFRVTSCNIGTRAMSIYFHSHLSGEHALIYHDVAS